MITLTLAEIAEVTGGTLHDVPDPEARVTAPSAVDSRDVVPGGMFVAVGGARVDGHDYVPQAVAAGAVCVLATRPVAAPAVVVDDVIAALGDLARHVLARTSATVVALTGSAGKTTTKDLLAQVLARHGETVATERSFNGELGLPLTVLRADTSTRFLVLEMGARHIGDIAYLTTLTPPKVGIVLNVGSAHVGEFGSQEAIAKAKSELVQALPASGEGGVAVLNADDRLVAAMAEQTTAQILTYGTGDEATIRATDVSQIDGRAAFTLRTPTGTAPVTLQLLGLHQVHNALAVAGAAHAVGMNAADIAQALTEAKPLSAGRLELIERPDGVTIINDAFNANAESMRAALHTLTTLANGRRTIAVLGEMRELGETAKAAHTEIGDLVADLGLDVLITVGTGPNINALTNTTTGSTPRIKNAETPEALLPLLNDLLRPGDTVLIKASRSVGLENFADLLRT
ncbi:UDP-N-acetylmuramoyl-tripeptide--D-alanyl-D-alanine ligase [Actinocorallia sp. A-T 12471]|uniref:UDP-N-acetylmuramoyl-tripeptide--D-alanyl-D- alanine ligase n=1 Tax=Actinocorallia sp. A-T 12471 TaxID=3089813 RepID=UPI0029D2DFF0|nr:UDP-N-acetylmuramoyl-tripeptide--D-alanyl-D-alanine ligase [Actinocorallia sp. A-T 12471]MDX6739197.1 UDP-N-acetylmuramoyl-tripeptide--D-alanyl-D-alanine ligase [Actinocorallia sp. A-T 12471]